MIAAWFIAGLAWVSSSISSLQEVYEAFVIKTETAVVTVETRCKQKRHHANKDDQTTDDMFTAKSAEPMNPGYISREATFEANENSAHAMGCKGDSNDYVDRDKSAKNGIYANSIA